MRVNSLGGPEIYTSKSHSNLLHYLPQSLRQPGGWGGVGWNSENCDTQVSTELPDVMPMAYRNSNENTKIEKLENYVLSLNRNYKNFL